MCIMIHEIKETELRSMTKYDNIFNIIEYVLKDYILFHMCFSTY